VSGLRLLLIRWQQRKELVLTVVTDGPWFQNKVHKTTGELHMVKCISIATNTCYLLLNFYSDVCYDGNICVLVAGADCSLWFAVVARQSGWFYLHRIVVRLWLLSGHLYSSLGKSFAFGFGFEGRTFPCAVGCDL
jgi:hypothetical protein